MKKSPEMSALSLVFPKKTTLNILRYGIITEHGVRVTDLEHDLWLRNIHIPGPLKLPALFDISLYLKSGNMAAATAAAKDVDVHDYPQPSDAAMLGPSPVRSGALPPGLTSLLPSLSNDDTKEVLKCVAINGERGEAVATDGHTLFLKKLYNPVKKSFLIDGVSVKIASLFVPDVPDVFLKQRREKDDTSMDVVMLKGNNWSLAYRVNPFSGYPQYGKVIPDRSKSIKITEWNNTVTEALSAFIEKSRPYFPSGRFNKKVPFYFGEYTGYFRNKELNYSDNEVFSFPVFSVNNMLISFNALKLEKVVDFIKGRHVVVTVGERHTEPALFEGGDFTALLMPLLMKTGAGPESAWVDAKDIDSDEIQNFQ